MGNSLATLYRVLAVLGLAALAWVLLHPRGVAVQVERMEWRRVIEIEREVAEMHTAPCAEMPSGAQLLERKTLDGAEHCRFQAPVWRMRRHVVADGAHPAAPSWPVPNLTEGERAGRRHASQVVHLADDDGRRWECRLPLAEWQTWKPGTDARLAVHRFSGVADCAGLSR
jgi:hypothetical protein